MCLSLVTERLEPELEGVFYKFFGKTDEGWLWPPCQDNERYRLKRWVRAEGPKELRVERYSWVFYPTGFHGFESIEDAKKHWRAIHSTKKLYRCKFRKGHTVGVEDDSVVIVAGEMLILGPVSEEEWNNV